MFMPSASIRLLYGVDQLPVGKVLTAFFSVYSIRQTLSLSPLHKSPPTSMPPVSTLLKR